MNLLILFIILNAVNVVFQTARSLATIKAGPLVAAIVNAITYGLYTVVVVYMVCELPLMVKVLIVAVCNFVGVFVVKLMEVKCRKDKLWKVEATLPASKTMTVHRELTQAGISHSYLDAGPKHTIFNIYCDDQAASAEAKEIIERYGARYFVSETKTL